MQSKYLIYGLRDPNTKEIRYIGRSCSGLKRPREHYRQNGLSKKKSHCNSWIKSLKGKIPKIEVLEYTNNKDELDALEIKWIAYAKAQGWNLTNHTAGGGGTSNFKHTEEAKRKISAAARAMWAAGGGLKLTEEIRYKCGSSTRGKKLSDSQRAKWASVKGTNPFQVLDKTDKIIGTFLSKNECAKVLRIDRKTISKGLNNLLNEDYMYRFVELKQWAS
jgi:group I intron endonuclease